MNAGQGLEGVNDSAVSKELEDYVLEVLWGRA